MNVTSPPIDRAQILKGAASLGALSNGVNSMPRILGMLSSDKFSAAEVAALINLEPALYARVLRVANSSYYGQARSVTTVERALVLLGLDAVRGIAAAACLDRALSRSSAGGLINMKAVVRHSLATAVAAQSLALLQHRSLAAEAFIAGLLHNLGIALQLHLDLPGIRAMLETRRTDGSLDIRALESERVVVGHEQCVAVVFEAWNLPDSLVAAVRNHHRPADAPPAHRDLCALVNLGATLALACGSTYALEPAPVPANQHAMKLLQVEEGDLQGALQGLAERVTQLQQALVEA